MTLRYPRPRLFCSACGAKAVGCCSCGATYIQASVAASNAIAKYPELSDRAIAKKTGIPHSSIQRARKSTDPNGSVGKRLGLDGKRRALPQYSSVSPQEETKDTPQALAFLDEITPLINALMRQNKRHETKMSPTEVGYLARHLRTIINKHLSPTTRARACADVAEQWSIDPAKLNTEITAAVANAARAWSELHERMLAATAAAESSVTNLAREEGKIVALV